MFLGKLILVLGSLMVSDIFIFLFVWIICFWFWLVGIIIVDSYFFGIFFICFLLGMYVVFLDDRDVIGMVWTIGDIWIEDEFFVFEWRVIMGDVLLVFKLSFLFVLLVVYIILMIFLLFEEVTYIFSKE